ncbi:MAG: hypothetical protein RR365_01110 [Bacteroides sp.]
MNKFSKLVIVSLVCILLCAASFVLGWKYTIYNQELDVQDEHCVTSTLFGRTDIYDCE